MAINFRSRDFFQPLSLGRYRLLMQRAQWWPPERLRAYQRRRLAALLRHAEATVPFYQDAVARSGLRPGRTGDITDLARLPLLTKVQLRERRADLASRDASRFRPVSVSTTGSTGAPVHVLLDRQTNALEFNFYWRHWGWFGYRLGDPFAQLSWADFSGASEADHARMERGTGRLLLNARFLSKTRATQLAEAMWTHRVRFLKGHPSAVLHLALFVRSGRLQVPRLRAVFTTGEGLEPAVREVIESVFQTRVADAYGSMERVIAACECPAGRMHVNADYGMWEILDERVDPVSGRRRGRVVGTSLHNMSMPLVRYDTGDLVERDDSETPCPCGRTFPTIRRVLGRSVDAIVTPDGRVVTAASIGFNACTTILQGQLVQEDLKRLLIRVLPTDGFGPKAEQRLLGEFRRLVGPSMHIDIERLADPEGFVPKGGKHRTVVSAVYQRTVSAGWPLP